MEGWAYNRFTLEQDKGRLLLGGLVLAAEVLFCSIALDIHTEVEEAGPVPGAALQLDEGCHRLLFRDSVIHFR